jgi:WD40 repeat protein
LWAYTLNKKCNGLFCMKQVRLWDIPQQKCVQNFGAHDGYVRGITFHPGGQQIITVGDDTTIKMWKTDLPDWG